MTLAARLPEYPWDELAPIAEKARAFPGGAVDLSVGTPVDPVPAVIQDALAAAANAPGYPLTAGTPELRSAAAGWLARSLDVHVDPVSVLPVIGTKEFIAWLPTMLGLGPADTVLLPVARLPDVRHRRAAVPAPRRPRSTWLARRSTGSTRALDGAPASSRLLWVNSPSNPTGRVLPAGALRDAVGVGAVARRGRWPPTSATSSSAGTRPPCRSCTSRCAATRSTACSRCSRCPSGPTSPGYRAGFVTGDPALMKDLLLVGRQAGMIVPGPVQAAMIAALSDDAHAAEQKARYAARRGDPRRRG